MLTQHLKPAIEAILFMLHKPIPVTRIRDIIDETIELEHYKAAIDELTEYYKSSDRGVELAEISGGFQFRTKLEHRDMLRRMFQITPVRMSQAMLEVLSIVAFNQPVTRERVEDIRGVECGHHLRNLMDKKLVKLVGRSDAPGRPMLYGTTREFLELFGLPSLKELPPLRDIEDMLPQNEVGDPEAEEQRLQSELEDIVADAKELEFADIEQEEERLFEEEEAAAAKAKAEAEAEGDEPKIYVAPEEEDGSQEEKAGAAEETQEAQAGADGDASTETESAGTPDGEAVGAEHQQDEVAGTVAFGSIGAQQEAEWPLDEKVEAQDNVEAGDDEQNDSDEQGAPEAEATEDPSERGDLQS